MRRLVLAIALTLALGAAPGCTMLFPFEQEVGGGMACSLACASDCPLPGAARCAPGDCVSELADDFEDGVRADAWDGFETSDDFSHDPHCALAEQQGQLRVELEASANASYCGYIARDEHDLRGDRASVEVVQATNPSFRAQTWFRLDHGGRAGSSPRTVARFLLAVDEEGQPAELRFEHFDSGSEDAIPAHAPTVYSAQGHRFWRFREAGGVLYWQTSASGACGSWVEEAQAELAAPLDAVRPVLGAGVWSTTPTENGGAAIFDRFNLPVD